MPVTKNYNGRDFESVLNNQIKRLKASKTITEANKKAILKFHHDCFSNGLSVRRVMKYLLYLPKLADMLGEDFTYRLVNNALQVYGQANKVKGWRWEGSIDERTCDYCYSHIMEDRLYRLGQFLPSLPAHAGCRCGWILIEK